MAVSLETLEAELARQDDELAALTRALETCGHRAAPEFFEELAPKASATPLLGIRG
jgi:hypothetical protein